MEDSIDSILRAVTMDTTRLNSVSSLCTWQVYVTGCFASLILQGYLKAKVKPNEQMDASSTIVLALGWPVVAGALGFGVLVGFPLHIGYRLGRYGST